MLRCLWPAHYLSYDRIGRNSNLLFCILIDFAVRLPDFICIGAQKSGTTWLYGQISNHPQVFMQNKELDFFFRSDDLQLYAQNFEGASSSQLCGDISPNYAAFVGLEEKIHAACPDARIIKILRNPVDRAFSQWKMARNLGNIPLELSFIESFRMGLQYMKRRGEYIAIIEEYSKYYRLNDRLAVFWYDDIRDRPGDLLERAMTFIGVDAGWRSPRIHEVFWRSPEPDVVINPEDALEIKTYYKPFDDQLRSLLRVDRLPWDAG